MAKTYLFNKDNKDVYSEKLFTHSMLYSKDVLSRPATYTDMLYSLTMWYFVLLIEVFRVVD